MPFDDGAFDAVFYFGILEHLPPAVPAKCLNEIKCVSMKHGVLILSTANSLIGYNVYACPYGQRNPCAYDWLVDRRDRLTLPGPEALRIASNAHPQPLAGARPLPRAEQHGCAC
jgi:SAM-dependent methyltransferase